MPAGVPPDAFVIPLIAVLAVYIFLIMITEPCTRRALAVAAGVMGAVAAGIIGLMVELPEVVAAIGAVPVFAVSGALVGGFSAVAMYAMGCWEARREGEGEGG